MIASNHEMKPNCNRLDANRIIIMDSCFEVRRGIKRLLPKSK